MGVRGEAAVPHLVGKALPLEDVPAGEADRALDVRWRQDLASGHALDDVRRESGDLIERLVGHGLASLVP